MEEVRAQLERLAKMATGMLGTKKEEEANLGVPGNKDEEKAWCKLLNVAWGRWEKKMGLAGQGEGVGSRGEKKGKEAELAWGQTGSGKVTQITKK